MKINRIMTVFLLLFFVKIGFAQSNFNVQKIGIAKETDLESYPVDVRPLLERFSKANGIDPEKFEKAPQQLRKAAWTFNEGDPYEWWASDFTNDQFYKTASTCRAKGTWCYIFVEDSLWNSRVDQNAVDKVLEAFDSKNANPNSTKGIYQTNIETFGNPPNVDNDPRIIIFILNIRDGYTGTGGYTAGYFYGYNEMLRNQGYPNSNEAEIYYLDGNPLNLKTTGGLNTGMGITAHEFQHMIHFNYIPNDLTFFNESWSEIAPYFNGYGLRSQTLYSNEPNQYLFEWRRDDPTEVLIDYTRAARFSLYLYEQFGAGIFKKYLENRIMDIGGLNNALMTMSTPSNRRFLDIIEDWFMANYLNNKTVSPGLSKWGYDYSSIPAMLDRSHYDPNVSYYSDWVYKYGVQYIAFKYGKNLSIAFTNNSGVGIKIKAIKYGVTATTVEDVPFGVNYSVPDYGTNITQVTFAVYMNDGNYTPNSSFNFSYASSGIYEFSPIEIAYDTTPPVAVYSLSVSDTVAVRFDGVNGTRLDSIRVALRNTVQIEGGVWRSGTSTFLGQRLAGPFMVAGKTAPSFPYPDPWTNWVKVDLRSQNIDASTNFVVGFIIDGVYENSSSPTNRVMHTSIPGTSAYHSYTYLHNPSSGTPGWYYIGDGTNISLYLIRAYVGLPTGVKEVIELLPSSFALNQNYPNPFNPSTVISYQLSVISDVQLKIFDILGREVKTLVSIEQPAGKYNINWNGEDNYGNKVSSGVYLYKLRAGNYVETKKMVLMR